MIFFRKSINISRVFHKYEYYTTIEIALRHLESDLGHKPNCHDLAGLFGDSPGVWGRILEGVGVPHGEYIAKVNLIKDHGIDAGNIWAFSKKSPKYGQRTRKGKIAPHINNLFNDIDNYRENQIFETRLNITRDDRNDPPGFLL
jgi:hypothetical protein